MARGAKDASREMIAEMRLGGGSASKSRAKRAHL
jgi:hypothetical protein